MRQVWSYQSGSTRRRRIKQGNQKESDGVRQIQMWEIEGGVGSTGDASREWKEGDAQRWQGMLRRPKALTGSGLKNKPRKRSYS